MRVVVPLTSPLPDAQHLSLLPPFPLAHTHIQYTASIGLLVIFITFTGQTWDDLAPSYLAEGFDRNVRRIVRRYPELNTSEPEQKYATN